MRPTKIKFSQDTSMLIVDDDPDQRKLLNQFIQDAFVCQTLEANDGLEALRIILQDKDVPNLVLLDLMMPYLNGDEFLKIIRGRSEFKHIPVIVCTHIDETQQMKGKINHQIHSYLVKPIAREQLLDKILDALHGLRYRVDYQ